MQDQQPLSPLPPAGTTALHGRSVASRLKKSLVSHSPAGGRHVSNGSAAGPEKAENGFADVTPLASPLQLSATDHEIVRLIGQHLKNLGMTATVQSLLQESRCTLEHPAAARFRMHALAGDWDMVMYDLKLLQAHVPTPSDVQNMKFMILEQKYLELLERGQVVDALNVLRSELSPLGYKTERVHELSTYLMFNNTGQLRSVAGWEGSSQDARQSLLERLQRHLPPSVMLPPRRLEALLCQALQWQYSHCHLHNTRLGLGLDPQSLLANHRCTNDFRINFPCETRQVLTEHCDEVWCARFSHNGKYLATGAKDSTVFIWEIDPETRFLRKWRTFTGHNCGAGFFCWSPDDRFLAVVGGEDGPDLWLWNVEKGELRVRMTHSPDDSLSTVAWHHVGSRFVTGGSKGQFYSCDLDGNVVESWEGVRIRALWCKRDGRTVLAADTHHRIRAYTFDDLSDATIIREQNPLMFFCLDLTERFVLCTIKGQGLHLWDLETRTLIKRYRGSKHGEYVVVSTFGGENQDYVSTGSEDGKVYVWHRSREDPVKVLEGHTAVVNAVSWNPVDPSMLVSCSDDGTVRIWGPEGSAPLCDSGMCMSADSES